MRYHGDFAAIRQPSPCIVRSALPTTPRSSIPVWSPRATRCHRRECVACGERFTTFETAELVMPRLIKQDGSRQPFDEEKLRAGMQRALEKRPVSVERLEEAIARIKQQLRATGEREVKSLVLGELVMTELSKLDEVAYIRFASVYRRFQDINEFREEIERLAREPSKSR